MIAEENKKINTTYEMSIKDDLITLKAEGAFLKTILEDIGQKMDIVVIARIPAEEKITIRFANLSLEEALKKFKKNYAYVTDATGQQEKIARIVVVPEGQHAALYMAKPKTDKRTAASEADTAVPEPFKFEFDPSKLEPKSGSSTVE
jgi:hypothetical protein